MPTPDDQIKTVISGHINKHVKRKLRVQALMRETDIFFCLWTQITFSPQCYRNAKRMIDNFVGFSRIAICGSAK